MTTNPLTITAPDGLPYVDFEREFDATPDRVYKAHSDPDLVAQWLGPDGYDIDIAEWDLRPGGSWAYIHRDQKGEEYGFRGVFHAARENELIIQTFEFAGLPDVVSIETLRLEVLDGGRCRLSVHAVYPSLEARDGIVASGQEQGITQGYARLDAVLAG